jgi:hypothetical protein
MKGNVPATGKVTLPFVIDDFRVSYAGPCPLNGGFCFGSEDGKLLIADEEIGSRQILPETTPSREPVNGVAFIGDVIGVSTRADVAFVTPKRGERPGIRSVVEAGSHSIVASPSKYFVAPMGRYGILQVKPEDGPRQSVIVSRAANLPLNFYRVICIATSSHDILACAARVGGVASTTSGNDTGSMRRITSVTFPGLDVVDLCSLGSAFGSAVAAVARDSTLILLRDVLLEQSPVTIRFNEIKGTAYRVFCSRGNLMVLTSTSLYVLSGLARRFLEGDDVLQVSIPIREMRMEAVDANMCRDRWMLVVLTDQVYRIDVDLLLDERPREAGVKAESVAIAWEVQSEEEESEEEERGVDEMESAVLGGR